MPDVTRRQAGAAVYVHRETKLCSLAQGKNKTKIHPIVNFRTMLLAWTYKYVRLKDTEIHRPDLFYGLAQYPSSWHIKPSAPRWKLHSNACHWDKTTSLDSRHPWQHHDPNKITTSRKVTRDPQRLAKKKKHNKTQVALCQAMSSLMLNAFYCTKLVLVDIKTERSLKGILSKKNFVQMRMHAGKQLEAPVAWQCLTSLFNRFYYLNEAGASSWAEGCIYKTGRC